MAKVKMHDGTPFIFCPGCNLVHKMDTRWRYNYLPNAPTFKPDVTFLFGPYPVGHKLHGRQWKCHCEIKGGKIRFFDDSEHSLAGQTVDLPDMEDVITNTPPPGPALPEAA